MQTQISSEYDENWMRRQTFNQPWMTHSYMPRIASLVRRAVLAGERTFLQVHYSPSSIRTVSMATGAPTPPALPPSPQAVAVPKVGVGVVVLRHLKGAQAPEVLLIKRGKRPSKGMWSFCGGSLELGETMVQCAVRETLEETGLTLRQRPSSEAQPFSSGGAGGGKQLLGRPTAGGGKQLLGRPTVFTAVDVIERDPDGSVAFHYAVVEVAAVPADPRAVPAAADDASEVQWVPAAELRSLPNLVPKAVEVVEEALSRFEIPIE